MFKLKVGLIGCGTIGREISQALESQIPEMELVALADINKEKAINLKNSLKSNPSILSNEALILAVDLVIEAASKDAAKRITRQALDEGKDIMVMSTGGLIGNEELFALAKENNCKIYLPSGAIAGLDGVKGAALSKIHSLTLTTSKPPLSLANAPYIRQNKIDLNVLTSAKLIFEGSAEQAVNAFPQNINVAATLSFSGIGVKKTKVRIIADPTLSRNIHEIIMEGEFGKIITRCENLPSPTNPKTSYLACLSAIATLKNIVNPVKIGT